MSIKSFFANCISNHYYWNSCVVLYIAVSELNLISKLQRGPNRGLKCARGKKLELLLSWIAVFATPCMPGCYKHLVAESWLQPHQDSGYVFRFSLAAGQHLRNASSVDTHQRLGGGTHPWSRHCLRKWPPCVTVATISYGSSDRSSDLC